MPKDEATEPREGAMNLWLSRFIQSRCTLSCNEKDEGASKIRFWGSDGSSRTMWTTFFISGLTLEDADRIVYSLSDVLSDDIWYYGCREDHPHATVGRHQLLHSCVSLVVGSAGFHQPNRVVEAIQSLILSSRDEQHSLDVFPYPLSCLSPGAFEDMASWVRFGVAYIDGGDPRRSLQDDVHRWVFGDYNISRLIFKQAEAVETESFVVEINRESSFLEKVPALGGHTIYVEPLRV